MRWVARDWVCSRCGGRGEGVREGWRWERDWRSGGEERVLWRVWDLYGFVFSLLGLVWFGWVGWKLGEGEGGGGTDGLSRRTAGSQFSDGVGGWAGLDGGGFADVSFSEGVCGGGGGRGGPFVAGV